MGPPLYIRLISQGLAILINWPDYLFFCLSIQTTWKTEHVELNPPFVVVPFG
jgi:hypothetical protein